MDTVKEMLDEYYLLFNRSTFILSDPIQVPHNFLLPEDIEISGFLTASLSWGQRPVIIRNALRLVEMMPGGPYEFLMNAEEDDFLRFSGFKHRTFNGQDCIFFLKSLYNIYRNHGGLKAVFYRGFHLYGNIPASINYFRTIFFSIPFPERTLKHVADVFSNAAAKRINLFLRWMVRNDNKGVDFGLWDEIPASSLFIPLDVHTGKIARELGLLKRKQNDWKAVEELTNNLRIFDNNDPVKYDYALFGLSAIGERIKKTGDRIE